MDQPEASQFQFESLFACPDLKLRFCLMATHMNKKLLTTLHPCRGARRLGFEKGSEVCASSKDMGVVAAHVAHKQLKKRTLEVASSFDREGSSASRSGLEDGAPIGNHVRLRAW